MERLLFGVVHIDREFAAGLAVLHERLIADQKDVVGRPTAIADACDRYGFAVIGIEHLAFARPLAAYPAVERVGICLLGGKQRQPGEENQDWENALHDSSNL